MKDLKLQQNLLKEALSSSKVKGYFLGNWEEKDLVGITEGHVIWLIPKTKFILDTEKLKEFGVKEFPIKNMFLLNHDSQADGVLTGDIKILAGKEAVKLQGKKGHVWVNRAFLNEFDKDRTFKISKSTAPVYVYEKGELVGLILPIKMVE